MTTLLIKLFIKNKSDTKNPTVRQSYGVLGGSVGIFCNVLLFISKFLAGLMTSSIAITADAFNNLSDAGSSIITLVGFKMAGKPPDHTHPFGHGRIEYLSGLFVSLAIILMAFELGKSSIEKILHPEATVFGILPLVILCFSILTKLWMGLFNRKLGKIIDSATMKATAMDSISDVVATTTVAAGMLISHFTGFNIDGFTGFLVSLFILYTGISTAKDSLNPLLGEPPAPELVEAIKDTVLSYPEILGIHDLIIHNYGPGQLLISLHAEVPSTANILEIHDVIDNIERELQKRYNCEAVIHMDPLVTDDNVTNAMRLRLTDLLKDIDPGIDLHDFRMVSGHTHTNLIFDVMLPYHFNLKNEELIKIIEHDVTLMDPTYHVVVTVEHAYV